MVPHSLDDYLSLNFVPDQAAASQYVRELLEPAAAVTDRTDQVDPAELLCQIIEDETVKKGRHVVALPLTGGYDSRGLLGAALRVLPASSIHCFTFGSTTLPDYVDAAAICSRLGLKHRRIDPNRIHWDLDRLSALGADRWERWRSLAPIDGVAVYDALAAAVGDLPVLSGYLGDAISGAHLRVKDSERTGDDVVGVFIQANHPGMTAVRGRGRLTQQFDSFLREHAGLLEKLPASTPFDLLDLGFRQALRIRSVTWAAFADCITPYEDPRWVNLWMSGDPVDRIRAVRYRGLYARAYPDVFAEPGATGSAPPRSRLHRIAARARTAVGRTEAVELPVVIAGRGDVRRNRSMAGIVRETSAAFDRRGIAPEVEALAAYDRLAGRSPTAKDFMTVRWAATAEMYLRAGVLS